MVVRMQDEHNDALLTTQAVADKLQMTPQSIRKMIRDGEIEAIKVGRKEYRIRQSVFEAYLAQHTTVPGGNNGQCQDSAQAQG